MKADDGGFDPPCAPVPDAAMATGSEDGDPGEQPNERPLCPDDSMVLAPPSGSVDVVEAVEDSPAAARAVRDGSVLPVDGDGLSDEDDPLTPEFRAPQQP